MEGYKPVKKEVGNRFNSKPLAYGKQQEQYQRRGFTEQDVIWAMDILDLCIVFNKIIARCADD